MSLNLLPKRLGRNDKERQAAAERELMRQEAKLGGQLFGPLPEGRRREFFCLNEATWIWYEEWLLPGGQRRSSTIRYVMRQDGVLKQQDGQVAQRLSRSEARNLYWAVKLYSQRVGAEYQRLLQVA